MRRLLILLCLAPLTPYPSLVAADPPKELAAAKYRLVGPYAGGRVSRACGVPGDPLTYYTATASGGVWKSSDGGLTWASVFDDQPTSSVGSIAVAPSDRNVVYVGSGEANIRGNVSPGAGLFKSEDGGKTWKHVWKQVGQIGSVAVHPKNADIAFAAVLGHAFGPNPERGVYRTTDGGKTWTRVYFKDEQTGASDVAIDPNNPRVVFAGMWQARRRPWELTSGGPGSDLAVSRDGGDTWESLKKDAKENGLPTGIWGKIGVAVAPSNGQRVYALIEAEKGGLFRSDDGGKSWAKANDGRIVRQRAWYYSTLTVHPTNPDEVYAPNVPLLKSSDGGRTFKSVRGPHHGDHHDLWIDPANPLRMINANDGGVDITTDGGKTWFAPPLPINQFYHVHADNAVPYRVMGCMQDLGSAAGPSRSLSGRISLGDWHGVGGGEAGHVVSDPSDPDVVYAGEYGGILTRFDRRTGQARNVSVNANNPSGIDPAKMPRRFQWTSPILISKHDPKTVYHAANVLFRTRDAGQTWEAVSKDLTRDDKHKQGWSGGPITGDNTGAEVYCTIFALAESPKQKGLLWAGTDDGKVWVTTDDCKTWTDMTANVPDMPDWGTVQCIEPSPFDAGTAYLVVDNHRMDDYRPHVWKTTDSGKTWTSITEGLDAGTPCHAVREDPKKKGQLYLGTERGVMMSPDSGKMWKSLQLNLPTVPVHDLVVKDDDLVVGTHGRAIWILDDLTPVRVKSAGAADLYPVAPAVKWNYGSGPVSSHHRFSMTANPPTGAVVWYQLGDGVKGDVTLEVLTAAGKRVAKAKGKAGAKGAEPDDDEDAPPAAKKDRPMDAKPGLNRFVWDLTHDGAEVIPGALADQGNPGATVPAAPGTYTVKLTAGGKTVEQKVTVSLDPRLSSSGAESARWTEVTEGKGLSAEEVRKLKALIGQTRPLEFRTGGSGEQADEAARLALSGDRGLRAARLWWEAAASEQESLALKVRDDITTLTKTVARLRGLQKQLALRKDLLKEQPDAKDLLKASEALGKKLSALEEKLHNPKAKVTYDIFAARGGAMLYSQLAWLLANVTDGDGPPTKAQTQYAAESGKQLAGLVAEFERILTEDVAKLNEQAAKLNVPGLYVPPAKK